jgi:hypothetical protein
MQTVNFNCPHCGNLMAVGTNLLGRNVRCPHCKQVVRAPAGAGEPLVQTPAPPVPTPAPTPPAFNIPKPTEHHESIFGERHDEDLFGSEPLKPTVPETPAPPPQLAETVSVNSSPAPPPTPVYNAPAAPTLDFASPSPGALEDRTATQRPPEGERPVYAYRPRTSREEAPGTPAFAWILLAYSALITIAAGFFGFHYFTAGDSAQHPYKAMPDVIRQYDPAKKPQVSFQGLPDPKLEIPKDLRVKLGEELVVGDLKVQPLYVEKKWLEATTKYVAKEDVTRGIKEHLVMTLRVTNLSPDTVFCPNDPAFNRARDWTDQQPLPYTALQVYRDYYCGIFKWPSDPDTEKEFIVGHEADELPLGPGEQRDTWVVAASDGVRTAGSVGAIGALKRFREDGPADLPLLWRVQLRRGLVRWKDESGKDVEVSATTVVGVEFQLNQIKW